MAFKPIQILINAKDQASEVFDKLNTKIAAVGTAILGYFGIQAFAGIVKGAADLETAMSRVQAATGATGKELEALRAAAVQTGNSTQFSAVQAAGALENLAKAGLDTKDALAALPAVIKLAQAGDIELATSAEFVTKAVMGMGLAFSDAGRVADVLALGANATNTSVTGLAQALSYAAPVASSLGLSLESTVAILGKFADAGIDASRAGTALNSILSQFSDPASKFRTELAAAGITTSNFEKALHQLGTSGAAGERAIASVGQEAGPALRALLNQGLGALDELTGKLKAAEGSADATAATMRNNLNGALSTLGNVWNNVVVALGTPVLPVLKQGVEQLSGALRSAVADGTIGRFGTAIAAAFESGIKWVREFVGSIDFSDATARVQAFADRTGQLFTSIGESARTAGDIVKTAWGVMTAGTNTVLAAIYGVGAAFAGVASNIQSGLALLYEGISKITFGSVAAAYRQAAAEIKLSAEATWAASDALTKKSGEAFDAAHRGAVLAQEGFSGLAQSAVAAGKAAGETVEKYQNVVQGLVAAAEAAGEARTKAQAAADAQREHAEKTAAAITRLRDEYQKAINTGNLQVAVDKLRELKQVTDAAAAAAGDNKRTQEEAAKDIAAAFQRAGIQTKESLGVAAQTAFDDFVKIRDSGQAAADGISAAWAKAASAAIAANDGVVPVWVQGEAAAKGYAIEVDEAGKATLQLVRTAAGLKGLAGAYDDARKSAESYGNAVRSIPASHDRRGQDAGLIGQDARQVLKSVTGNTREERLSGQNAVDNRLMFELRDRLRSGDLTAEDIPAIDSVIKALEQNAAVNNAASKLSAGFMSLEGLRDANAWKVTKQQFEDARNRLDAGGHAGRQPGAGFAVPTTAAPAIVSNITIEGLTRSVGFADEESQRVTEALLRQLAQGRGTAL